MEISKKGYIGFILASLITYAIFFHNYYENLGFTDLMAKYQQIGIIFSLLLIIKCCFSFFMEKKFQSTWDKIKDFMNKDFLVLFSLLILSHVIYTNDYLIKSIDIIFSLFFNIDVGIRKYLVYGILIAILFILSIFILLKKDTFFKKHFKKIYVLPMTVIMFLNLFYGAYIPVFLNHNLGLYQNTITNAVRANQQIASCTFNAKCFEITIDELNQQLNLTPKDDTLGANIYLIQNFLLDKIKTSNDNIVETHSFKFENLLNSSEQYVIIAAYNKQSQYLIIDINNGSKVFNDEIKKFQNIIGLSSFGWLSIMFILVSMHNFFIYRMRRGKNDE